MVSMTAIKVALLLMAVAWAPSHAGRNLLQASAPAPASELRIPANRQIAENAMTTIELATEILSRAGQVDSAGIQEVTLDGAHELAELIFYPAYAGQSPAVHAGVAAAGAALLAAGGALTNNPAVISEAQTAISTAMMLIDSIEDVEILSIESSEFANLITLANMAHDGTLTHYWQNATSGPQDNETFASQVETASGLYEIVEEQLDNGLSESLAVLAGQEIAHNLLAAIYTFGGNDTAVATENIYLARVLLKAVRVKQTSEACSTTWTAIDPAVETAVESATTATTSLSASDLMTAEQNAMTVLSQAECAAVAPALAPVSMLAAAGRK